MKTMFLPHKMVYDGTQLHGLFSYQISRGIAEDSLIAFLGEASVREGLIDYEDKLNDDFIYAKEMLHFILTIHGSDLTRARLWQLLLVQHTLDELQLRVSGDTLLCREGDDIYVLPPGVDKLKLTVSIATVSSNQKELVHLAVNVDDTGAPVPTSSLSKLNINPQAFALGVMNKFEKEYSGVRKTLYKVTGV